MDSTHPHEHGHNHDEVVGLQGSPKTMFFLGLFVGIAACVTLTLIFLVWSIFSGHGLSLGGAQQAGNNQQQVVQQQPSPTPSQPAAPTGPVNVAVGHFPVQGDAKAKVTVIQFADFRCPFCERFYNDAEKSLIKDYVTTGKVKFAFRSFAFLGPASTAASEAAECANDQGQFWKFHDWMYEHQADESNTDYYSKPNLIKYATDLGLNKDKFTSCLNSDQDAAKVTADMNDGQAAGVNGTPTTFVNGVAIVGAVPYAQVKAAIDAALAK